MAIRRSVVAGRLVLIVHGINRTRITQKRNTWMGERAWEVERDAKGNQNDEEINKMGKEMLENSEPFYFAIVADANGSMCVSWTAYTRCCSREVISGMTCFMDFCVCDLNCLRFSNVKPSNRTHFLLFFFRSCPYLWQPIRERKKIAVAERWSTSFGKWNNFVEWIFHLYVCPFLFIFCFSIFLFHV